MFENFEKPDCEENFSYMEPLQVKKGLSAGKVVAIALVCALLAGALGAGLSFLLMGATPAADAPLLKSSRDTRVELTAVTEGELTPAQVYAQNVAATVGITTSVTTNYWGYPTTAAASGSGFILTEDGYVLTNFHVVEGASSIRVSCYDGTVYEAAMIGYDAARDVAVLKVEATGLLPAVLGDSDALHVGDPVVAIGNPLGELTFSLTCGAVSAKDRTITLQGGSTMRLLQTDCAINSGNSGGALFNLYGEVIGITNAKYSASGGETSIDNIGFAIPINDVEKLIHAMIEEGYYTRPYVGITVTDVSAESQSYGLPQGAAIRQIAEGSPAEQCGLLVNDIITHVDGVTASAGELVVRITDSQPGDTLQLRIYRAGATMELTLTVGQQIQRTAPAG